MLLPLLWNTSKAEVQSSSFTLDYVQHILNSTDEYKNIVVAPYAAYQLYKELFEPHDLYGSQAFSSDQAHMPPSIIRNQYKNDSFIEQNVTMKARWTFNFQTRDTSKRPFHQLNSGDRTYLVDNLRKDDVFRYTFMEQMNASVLELPLHLNEIKLFIILPQEEEGLEEVKDYLVDNMDVIEDISKSSYSMTLVRVMLPKFRLDYEDDLRDFYDEVKFILNCSTFIKICYFCDFRFRTRTFPNMNRFCK